MFNIRSIILSLGITIALLFNFDKDLSYDSAIQNSVMSKGVLVYLLFVLVYLGLNKIKKSTSENQLSWVQWLLGFFLAGIQLSKMAIEQTDGLSILYSSRGYAVVSLVVFGSFVLLFQYIQKLVLIFSERSSQLTEEKGSKATSLLRQYPMVLTIIILLICWLPSIIINYPAILPVDGFRQLRQYYGEVPILNAHPPIHTILFGSAVSLGRKLGSANLGLFISTIPQILTTAFAFGLATTILKKLKAPIWLLWFNVILGALSPGVMGLLMVSTKDLLFTSTVLILYCLYTLYLMTVSLSKEKNVQYELSLGIAIFVVTTLVILLRKNGVYMVFPVIVIVIIEVVKALYTSITNKNSSFTELIKLVFPLIIAIAPIPVAQGIDSALMQKYDMVDGVKKSEALSIPFQQTARYVKEFPDEVTNEEKNAIKNVLAYEDLAELYVPHVSDNVKRTHPRDVSDEEYKEYFEAWWSMFKKHPRIYLESTLSQNYYLFSPENMNNYYSHLENGIDRKKGTKGAKERKLFVAIRDKVGIVPTYNKVEAQDNLLTAYTVIDSLPLTSILSNFSLFVMLIMIIMGLSIKKKCFNTLKLSLPIFVLLGTVFAGPIIRGYLRYGVPFIFITPVLFGFFVFELRMRETNTNK